MKTLFLVLLFATSASNIFCAPVAARREELLASTNKLAVDLESGIFPKVDPASRPYYQSRRYDVLRAVLESATWTRSGTTATATFTSHGLSSGNTYNVTFSSDLSAITVGAKTVTVLDANTFTFTCLNAGATSGTVRGGGNTDVGVESYFYQNSVGSVSNLFYGNSYATPFTYTNAAGWKLVFDGSNLITISNASGTLMWSKAPGSLLPVHPNFATAWTLKNDAQTLHFPFADKHGAVATGPQVSVESYHSVAAAQPKIVVLDGDSRSAGWPQFNNYGSTYLLKAMGAHPFLRNAYFTNFAIAGNGSLDVSNRYASHVYPLRPQNGQVGYYVVWTGANGDTPEYMTSIIQPLFKQAKKDGWTVVAVTSPPTPAYDTAGNLEYGEQNALINIALRGLNGNNGIDGCWDVLVDLESVFPNLFDLDFSTDGLHPVRAAAALRIGEYFAHRIAQGTMTDGNGFNIIPPLLVGTYAKYGTTNVILRVPRKYPNMQTAGGNFTAGEGFAVATNLTRIPLIPNPPGSVFHLNSNGLPYLLVSTNGTGGVSTTWTKTNALFSVPGLATFQRILADGAANTVMPANTWTNIGFTTNIFSGQTFDDAGAFTLSNSFLIVTAAGGGNWEAESRVTIYDNTGAGSANCATRIYRWNNTAQTLMPGEGGYSPLNNSYGSVNLHANGVITLVPGDIIALQARAASANWEVGKNVGVIGMGTSSATLKLKRITP